MSYSLVNLLRQSWGSVLLWAGIMVTVGLMINSIRKRVTARKQNAWQKRVKDSVPASTSSQTGQPIATPGTMKKSAVILLMIPLMVVFSGAGYAGRDMQLRAGYKAEHEKWMSCLANWEKVYFAYEVKYVPKDK